MTKEEFYKLEFFNEKKFKKGRGVIALVGDEPTFPCAQRYYEGHPEPIVLTIDEIDFSYNIAYARNKIRMLPQDRYRVVLLYSSEAEKGVEWCVWDGYNSEKIASFLNASDGAKESAEEYATFLNDVQICLREREYAQIFT